jgi:hypothetical protein
MIQLYSIAKLKIHHTINILLIYEKVFFLIYIEICKMVNFT